MAAGRDAVQRYAFERQPEHLWAVGETDQTLESLSARTSPVPRDNLRRWELWAPRVEATFGPDYPHTLTTRGNVAFWTARCGDARKALRLSEALLRDRARVLGRDYPTRSRPATTSLSGPACAGMPARRCGFPCNPINYLRQSRTALAR